MTVARQEGGFMPCEDDEDLCDLAAGSGAGELGEHGLFTPSQSDSEYQILCALS